MLAADIFTAGQAAEGNQPQNCPNLIFVYLSSVFRVRDHLQGLLLLALIFRQQFVIWMRICRDIAVLSVFAG